MNRYGATMVAASMLLTLAACGGKDAAMPVTSQEPVISATPTRVSTPKPMVDPTVAAKQKALIDYATSYAYIDKGIRDGGAGYPYEKWMVGDALSAIKANMSYVKGIRRAKVSGYSKLLESKITAFDSKAKTATVTSCAVDNYTAVAKNGVVIAKPPGKVTKIDKVKLLKGRWMVFSTDTKFASYGCAR